MSLEQLATAINKAIGTKQTLKAVDGGYADKVYVAQDAETHVTRNLLKLCEDRGYLVELVPSMRELGKACGIEVGAASAAIIKIDQKNDGGKEVP